MIFESTHDENQTEKMSRIIRHVHKEEDIAEVHKFF